MRLLIATQTPQRFGHWLASLNEAGHEVRSAAPERRDLGQAMGKSTPEVVLVDLCDGTLELGMVRSLLGQLYFGSSIALIAVVPSQMLAGFQVEGPDDVLEAEATPAEVIFRARRVRERRASEPAAVSLGELSLRPAEGLAFIAGQRISLRHREFELLRFLMSRPNRVFRREELAREVWGPRFRGSLRTVDTHVCRLRERLGDFGEQHLQTVRGVGYRLARPQMEGAAFDQPLAESA